MQCHSCGSQVPEGMAFCQQCGMPISPPPPSSLPPTVAASQPPYGNPSPGASYNPSSIPPTVAASQPPYGNPGSGANYNPSSIPPTVAASQPPYGNPGPYTDYNPSTIPSNGQGYEGAPNPYVNVPPYNPYGQPQPSNVPPYAPPPPNNVPPYASLPQSNPAAAYGAGVPAFANPMPVKPKRRVGLIAGIVIAILAIVIVGGAVLASKSSHTTTTTTTTQGPSGNTIDSTVSSIITNIQMASAVDTNTLKPTTLSTRFKKDTDVYATFQFDFRTTDVNQQNPGYVEAKYYRQSTRVFTGDPLKVDDSVAPNGRGYGYFTVQYPYATTAGSVELYWCRQSNCSDEKLAQTTTFTVY